MATKIFLADTSAKLEEALKRIKDETELGLDLEADSLYHYFEKVCLIQISTLTQVYIIDPLANIDLSELLKLLATKLLIIHGANYDLRQLKRNYGFIPAKIFDTMAAAQLAGHINFSLKALVKNFFALELSKSAQKLNWSERPLKENMLCYAGNDAAYLPALKQILSKQLQALGRLSWLEESCTQIIEAALSEKPPLPPDKEWRIKGTSTLTGQALAFAKALWYWREAEAKKYNRPSFKILSNQTLLELALWASLYPLEEALAKVSLPRDFTGKRLSNLKKVLAETYQLSPLQWPRLRCNSPPKPNRYINAEIVKRLTELRDQKAGKLGLDPALLATRATLDEIAFKQPSSIEELKKVGKLMNWQVELLGEEMLSLVAGA
jgi:ribonuclease D